MIKEDLNELEKTIGYFFKDKQLLVSALTHPSYLNEVHLHISDYQRLEFLGDAVLEYLASDFLFRQFKKIKEGRLTEIRAALVRTESLAEVAQKLGLGKYIYISKGEDKNEGRSNQNILADCLEALIAAIYLDSGLEEAGCFFNTFIKPELTKIVSNKLYLDNKTQLQEYAQAKHKQTPEYKLIETKIVNKQTEFEIGVYIDKKCLSKGKGRNKKTAQQDAAKNALLKLELL